MHIVPVWCVDDDGDADDDDYGDGYGDSDADDDYYGDGYGDGGYVILMMVGKS